MGFFSRKSPPGQQLPDAESFTIGGVDVVLRDRSGGRVKHISLSLPAGTDESSCNDIMLAVITHLERGGHRSDCSCFPMSSTIDFRDPNIRHIRSTLQALAAMTPEQYTSLIAEGERISHGKFAHHREQEDAKRHAWLEARVLPTMAGLNIFCSRHGIEIPEYVVTEIQGLCDSSLLGPFPSGYRTSKAPEDDAHQFHVPIIEAYFLGTGHPLKEEEKDDLGRTIYDAYQQHQLAKRREEPGRGR